MGLITLYHGSQNIIEKPRFGAGKKNNDYGRAFYCTEHIELAKEWACGSETDGYANGYELDTAGLVILNLSDGKYNILNWLAILLENRKPQFHTPVEKRGAEYLISNFMPDYKSCDVIVGYRADDSYFSFARAFVTNAISLGQLGLAMKLGKLGEQYALKSQRAFDRLSYKGFYEAKSEVYYSNRKARDAGARAAYFKLLEKEDADGLFIRDIIREGMKQGDTRLQ